MSTSYEPFRNSTDYNFDHLQQPTANWNLTQDANKKAKRLSILLTITCIGFIGAVIGIVCVLFLDINDSSSSSSSVTIPTGYILDGPVWHTVFYRMTNESGIAAATSFCSKFKKNISSISAVSVHCGVQNSIEQVSFGQHGKAQNAASRSLEYGFAFTFETNTNKYNVVNNNKVYLNFRSMMDKYRDEMSFGTQNYKGIWIFDWTHGATNRTNMRPYNSTKYVKQNSTWHFCYFRFKNDEYTYHVTPTIIDNYRDLENTIVSPYNSSKKLVSLFSFGIQSSLENLSFGSHNGTMFNRSTEYGHVSSYDTFDEKEFMVGANHTARPLYDNHHDLFKAMIGGLHPNGGAPFFGGLSVNDSEGVFVFDFTDSIVV